MNICILCTDDKVSLVREKANDVFPNNKTNNFMLIPLSENGEEPATHWFCNLNGTEIFYKKILKIQEHSIIEESKPISFLNKHKLRIINKRVS